MFAEIDARDIDEPACHDRVERARGDGRAERVGEHEREPVAHGERAHEAARDDGNLVGVRVNGKLREIHCFAGEQLVPDQERQRVDVEGERLCRTAGLVDVDREPPGAGAENGDAFEARRHQRLDEVEHQRALPLAPHPVAEQVLVTFEDRQLPRLGPARDRGRDHLVRARVEGLEQRRDGLDLLREPGRDRSSRCRVRGRRGGLRLALQLLHARLDARRVVVEPPQPHRPPQRGIVDQAGDPAEERIQTPAPLATPAAAGVAGKRPGAAGAAQDVREQRPLSYGIDGPLSSLARAQSCAATGVAHCRVTNYARCMKT